MAAQITTVHTIVKWLPSGCHMALPISIYFLSTHYPLEFIMVKKVKKTVSQKPTAAAVADSIKASAQQMYLAGLAQFTKAQKEGGKVFEGLVKEGLSIQRRTQAVAEERISEVTNRAATVANDVASKASGQWNKLEDIFEERVARALNKLGVPSAKDIDALIKRIDALGKQVGAKPVRAAGTAKAAAKNVRAKAAAPVKAAKKAAKKASKKA
jgi:poly(hydroxyalkanoate) granule-associated protein